MNFKDAIELVVRTSHESAIKASRIADIINQRQYYSEWKGKPVDAALVEGRAQQHSDVFSVQNGNVALVSKNAHVGKLLDGVENFILSKGKLYPDNIILLLIFWARIFGNENLRKQFYSIEIPFQKLKDIKNHHERLDAIWLLCEVLQEKSNLNFKEWADQVRFSYESELQLNELVWWLDSFDFSEEAISQKDFTIFFNRLTQGVRGRLNSGFINNRHIYELIKELVYDLKYGSFFDPFAGRAELISTINLPKDCPICLQDIDNNSVFIGWMNMFLNGYSNFSFFAANSLMYDDGQKFDFIITEPPIGGSIGSRLRERYSNIHFKYDRLEAIQIDYIISKLNPAGRAVIVVPDSILLSPSYLSLRHFLIQNDLIETVISLPSYENTSIKLNLLVISKKKDLEKRQLILFQDLNNSSSINDNLITISKDWLNIPKSAEIVSLHEISSSNFTLSTKHYLSLLPIIQGSTISIGGLTKAIYSGKQVKTARLIERAFAVEANSLPFVTIKDLSEYVSEFVLDIEKIDRFIMPDDIDERNILREPAILIAKIGNKLKPTFYDGQRPIVVSNNVFLLLPDSDRVLPEYLVSQLNEEYVKLQVDNIRTGSAQPFIRLEDFKNVRIRSETLAVQREKLITYYKNQTYKTEQVLAQQVEEKSLSEVNILAAVQHELRGQLLQPLTSNLILLKHYLNRKEELNEPFKWQDNITQRRQSQKVNEAFQQLEYVVEKAKDIFDNMQSIIDLDESKLKYERVNVQEFIKSKVDLLSSQLHDINVVFSFENKGLSKIECDLDPEKFSNVIVNFIRNSIQHGFTSEMTQKYITFNVSKSSNSSEVIIDMLDNGKGFEESLTFENYITFGVKSNSNGSGIGGYLLYRTVQIHGGTIEQISTPNTNVTIPSEHYFPFKSLKNNSKNDKITIRPGVHLKITIPATKNIFL